MILGDRHRPILAVEPFASGKRCATDRFAIQPFILKATHLTVYSDRSKWVSSSIRQLRIVDTNNVVMGSKHREEFDPFDRADRCLCNVFDDGNQASAPY